MTNRWCMLFLVSLACGSVAMAADVHVAYREIFPTGPSVATSGWHRHSNANAVDVSTMDGWAEAPGLSDEPPVNSKPADTSATWKGSIWCPNGDFYALWSDEYTIDKPIARISWVAADKNDPTHVILRAADGQWYASEKSFAGSDIPKKADGKFGVTVLDVKATTWHKLDFVPGDMAGNGGKLSEKLGEIAELPAGKFTAFGLFVLKRTATQSYDTFTVTVEGEVTVAALPTTPAGPTIAALSALEAPKVQDAPYIADTAHPAFGQVVVGGGGFLTGIYPSPAQAGFTYLTCDMVGPWRRTSPDKAWELIPVVGNLKPTPGYGSSGIAMHPTNAKIAYADLGNGASLESAMGIYKTIDGGITWDQILAKYSASNNDGNGETGMRHWGPSLAIDAANPAVVYWASRKDGVWRSLDDGKTWQQVFDTKSPCRNVVVDATDTSGGRSASVYVGVVAQGIYASHDGGNTFLKDTGFAKIAGEKSTITWLRAARDGVVYASAGAKVLRHDKAGWHDVTPTIGKGDIASVGVDIGDSNRVVAIRTAPGWGQGRWFLRSTDGGKTWSAASKLIGDKQTGWLEHFEPMMGAAVVEIDPHAKATAYICDAFEVWQTDNAWDDQVKFSPQYKGCESAVTLTLCTLPAVKGAQVAPLFSGLSDIRGFRHASIFSPPEGVYIMADQDWSTYVNGIDFCEADPMVVYAAKSLDGTNFGRLLRSTDNGKTWIEATNPYPNQAHSGGKISVSATEPGRVVYFAGDGKAPVFTTDGGRNWKACKIAGTEVDVPTFYYRAGGYNFAMATCSDRVDGQAFYGYRRDDKTKTGQIWSSRDGGESWSMVNNKLPTAETYDSISPVQLISMPDKAGELWMTLEGNGLYHSTDFGVTWTQLSQFKSWPTGVAAGAADPRKPQSPAAVYVYAKASGDTQFALHQSLDRGATWQRIANCGYEKTTPMIFAADRQIFGRVYLGTPGLGIWYVQTDQVTR